MEAKELEIKHTWLFTPRQHADDRGVFLEWFKADAFAEATGRKLTIAQANHSVSKQGTLRGIHFADVPPSQAKFVYCPKGAVLDVIIDIRVGSPTYGRYTTAQLDDVDRRAVFISEGLGHAFVALTDDANVTYLCSTGYNPTGEHGINPLDPVIGIEWPMADPVLSAKDAAAPSLAMAAWQGLLPTYDACLRFYDSLRTE